MWIHPDSNGYDGQWYRIVARDPWMQSDLWRYLDTPRRQQRILLPATAWLLAAGQSNGVDAAYIAATLGFPFLGVWFTATWSANQGRSPL